MTKAYKDIQVNFKRNLHHEDMFEMLAEVAYKECGTNNLCTMEFSNIYYNKKLIRLDTTSFEVKTPVIGSETSDVVLWFKIAKKKTKDALRDVNDLLEIVDNIKNIKYAVNGYEVKTDYAIMSFDLQQEYRRCRGIDIHFKDK